jgi:hypothetical protein
VNNKPFHSITFRILAAIMLPALFACLALTSYYLHTRTDESRTLLETRGRQLARDIAAMSEYALISGSGDYLEDTIATLIREPQIHSIAVFDKKGKLFLSSPTNADSEVKNAGELMRFSSTAYRLVKDIDTFDIGEDINLDAGQSADNDSRREPIGEAAQPPRAGCAEHVGQRDRRPRRRRPEWGVEIGLATDALALERDCHGLRGYRAVSALRPIVGARSR